MKKILLMFTLALCIIFSACTFLCAAPMVDYSIYKVTKIGLSYKGLTTPEVEITLSEVFDFQQGVSLPANFASDKVMYRGDIPDGTITGIWVYATDVYSYDAAGTPTGESHDPAWIDCRPGIVDQQTNISIAVSEGERAKIIIDYTSNRYDDTKEAL